MKKIKLILLAILLGVSCVSAQTFTNVVDQKVYSHEEFNFNYKNQPEQARITNALTFFVTFSDGSSTNIYGTLKHQDTERVLFSDIQSTNGFAVYPINDFYGDHQNGEWKFYFWTKSPVTVHSWGVSTIPEPSSTTILIMAFLSFMFIRRNR